MERILHRVPEITDEFSPQLNGKPGSIEKIAEACTGDLLEAFGLYRPGTVDGRNGSPRSLASVVSEPLFRVPAARLARQVSTYDTIVGDLGLGVGAAWAVEQLSRGLSIFGAEDIPENGPVLVVSNHPGLADSLSLFAALPRDDLRILAAERAFLQALPNTSRYLIPVDDRENQDERASGLGGLRRASRHLKLGGTLLTFPRGGIEPDPASMSGAEDSLAGWRTNLDFFIRLVPEATVIPAIVSGVISPDALASPLTRLRRLQEDKRWLAASLQMIFPRLRNIHTEVRFGNPIRKPTRGTDSAAKTSEKVLAEARRMIRLSGDGTG